MKPRVKRFKLKGPLEREIQPWILASLGAEQRRSERTKEGKTRYVSTGLYITIDSVFWRNNSGAYVTQAGHLVRYGVKGSADIIGVVRGVMVCLEVKRDHSEQQTPEQREFERHVCLSGGVYAVVTCPSDALEVVAGVRSCRALQ